MSYVWLMIGHVFITGLIGTIYESDGTTIKEKGVELLDVVSQFEALDEGVEQIYVHINSPGGYVPVGDAIAEFLAAEKNVFTIAEEVCASIATKIHLSVPLQNRSVQEGCEYMIHNPFLAEVTGDADQLQQMADSTKKIEEDLEAMYVKATGISKVAISGLMQITTSLSMDQLINLKFAFFIIKKEQPQALALIYRNMSNSKVLNFKQRMQNAMAAAKGEALPHTAIVENNAREAKAVILDTDKGPITTSFADIAVGDEALWADGTEAPDDTYTVTSEGIVIMGEEGTADAGFTIVVKAGKIDSITPKAAEAPEAEDSIESLKAKLEAEEAKNATLTTSNATLTTEVKDAKAETEETVKGMEDLAKLSSNYVVPDAVAHFRNNKDKQKPTSMKERRKGYKPKN